MSEMSLREIRIAAERFTELYPHLEIRAEVLHATLDKQPPWIVSVGLFNGHNCDELITTESFTSRRDATSTAEFFNEILSRRDMNVA